MKIAVMGTGGVGGFYGSRLAERNIVSFIARGAHLAAIQAGGLKLEGPEKTLTIQPALATGNPAEVGFIDLVLFTVKLYDTEAAAEAIRPLVGPDTRILSLQNGVDGGERLARVFGEDRVWAGPVYVSALITEPGTVRYFAGQAALRFGTWTGAPDPLADRFLAACLEAGINATYSGDVRILLWEKFILLATNSALSASTRLPVVFWYRDPDMRATAIAALNEVKQIALAEGVRVDDDIVNRLAAFSETLSPHSRASLCNDLLRGGRMELDSLSGLVVRLGEKHGVPTPVHKTLFAALKPYKDGAPATDKD